MITLNDITLCAIDCSTPRLALRALNISMQQCLFADVLFFSDTADEFELPGCRMVTIPKITSRADYSRWVIKDLGRFFKTSHVLIIQWDGYIVNAEAWRAEFLDFDYIGAPWGFHRDNHRVGNGGFSLRSRRLFEALADNRIVELDPEDESICRRYRPLLESDYGIRFADEELAGIFSFETTYPKGLTFGFHGLFNIWMFLPAQELSTFVEHLAAGTIAGPQFLRLGKNYLELGRKEEAALILKRRLALVPEDPEAQALLKMALPTRISAPTGRNEPCPCGSGKRYKHCCGQDSGLVPAAPANAEALLLEATRHHQSRHLNEAEALYGQVLRLEPSNVFALQYSGVIAMQRGNATRGEDLVRQSLALRSDIPDFYNNLGLCLRMQDRLIEATAAYREALRLNPSYAEGENNLGLDLLALGLVSDSIEHCQRAIELRPDFAEAHWNLGLSLLTQGNLKQGWQEFEWRLKCQPFDRDGLSLDGVVLWQGQPLEGKTLLVRREQGLGDTLQMLRFIPDLVERGASVLLNVNPELQDLAASVSSAIKLVDRTTPLPKIDYYINLMSLPHRLDISLDSLPDSVPYMLPSSTFTADWQARLPKTDQLRVGLVWAGNPKHKNDRNRSCPLDELATLINTPGIAWFSLQKGPGRDQLMTSPHLNMVDLSPQLNSFSDTAAAMLSLDLVITVDTSVAHLAGALGRPVWVMLPFAADWRWLTKQEDSPWYPSARLFRQSRNGDWQGVCENISRALMEWPQTDHQ